MSDKYEQLKKNLKHLSSTYSPGILVSTLDGTRMAITDLQEENVSLITTIESQKEEIESKQEIIEHLSEVGLRNFHFMESQKAITELAVKGFEEVKIALKYATSLGHLPACTCPSCNALGTAEYSLFEIERLSHE